MYLLQDLPVDFTDVSSRLFKKVSYVDAFDEIVENDWLALIRARDWTI